MKNANSTMASTKRGRSRPSAGWMYCLVRSLHGGPSESAIDKLCRLLFFIGTLKDAGPARVVPTRIPAKHQSLLHLAGQAPWPDEAVL
ncbi:MAG: hypothetical protein CR217_12940 [Beijerinckiaceae bacterium]|nr:MAG: hypothetical protein CR217_12940 [Beijerinckiaceae bacterium]